VFLGATQEELAAVYRALTASAGGDGPGFTLLQLG
jgi:hypothetical protein